MCPVAFLLSLRGSFSSHHALIFVLLFFLSSKTILLIFVGIFRLDLEVLVLESRRLVGLSYIIWCWERESFSLYVCRLFAPFSVSSNLVHLRRIFSDLNAVLKGESWTLEGVWGQFFLPLSRLILSSETSTTSRHFQEASTRDNV